MRYKLLTAALAAAVALPFAAPAGATDLEVTHWWTSGGEAAAVAELAKAFDATGNKWVDGAIAGAGNTARPIMISRITGGDPMGATQFNHGRQAEELVEAGLMRDLTDVATKEKWKEIVRPASLLDSCTVDGKIYCVPVNIHSWQWLWLSNKAFADAGVAVPKNWDEFVAAAPALEKAGMIPLAIGGQPWQTAGAFNVLIPAIAGKDVFLKVYQDKDERRRPVPRSPRCSRLPTTRARCRRSRTCRTGTRRPTWSSPARPAARSWATGRRANSRSPARWPARTTPACRASASTSSSRRAATPSTSRSSRMPEKAKAQEVLASTMLNPATQVAFNLKKGSLPVRGDVDLAAANDCMKKGLDILAKGNVIPDTNQLITEDTNNQMNDLFVEFFKTPSLTPEDAQKRFAEIIAAPTDSSQTELRAPAGLTAGRRLPSVTSFRIRRASSHDAESARTAARAGCSAISMRRSRRSR